MNQSAERSSKFLVPAGLAALVWFGALFHAAYDLWAASVVFLAGTVLVSVWTLGHLRHETPVKLPLAPAAVLFLSAVWMSSIHAVDTNTTRLEAWGWTFSIAFFYLLVNTLDTDVEWNRFFYCAGSVMVVMAGVCLWQQSAGYPDTFCIGEVCFWEKWTGHPDVWGHWEIPATLINSLVLAGFTLNAVFLFWEDAQKGRRGGIFLFCTCLFVLALARSWWSYICLLAGFAVYYQDPILSWIKMRKRVGFAVGAILLTLLAAVVVLKVRVHTGPYKGSSRYYYWYTAVRIWLAYPWTGIGLGGFATAYPYFRTPQFQSTLFVHSFPLQWLCETGILGIAGLALMVVSAWKFLAKNRACQAALVAVLAFSMLSINLEYLLNKILLLILLAATLRTENKTCIRIKPLWIGVFCISLWLMSPFWVRMFIGSQWVTTGLTEETSGHWPQAQASYQKAISIDPANAEAYAGLARIYRKAYHESHDTADLSRSQDYLQDAMRWKNDIRYRILRNGEI